jgi:signal transduction histidine kinase
LKTRLKIIVSVVLAFVALNSALYFSQRVNVSNLMLALEKEQAVLAIQRLLNALERETIALDELNHDWAAWDDTYRFVLDGNQDYVESNLVDSTYISSRLDLVVLLNAAGQPVYQQAFDRGEELALPVPESFFRQLNEQPDIWQFTETAQFSRGFLRLPEGVLQLSVRPIITSNNQGPVRGAIIMGRFFNDQEHVRLMKLTEQIFALDFETSPQMSAGDLATGITVDQINENQLSAHSRLPDLFGRPLWQVRALYQRNFYQRGLRSVNTFMGWTLALTGGLALLLIIVADKLVVARKGLVDSRQRYQDLSVELQTILDGITSPILLVSKESRVVWVNKAGAGLYSQLETDVSGKLIVDLPFESFDDAAHCPVRRALGSGRPEEESLSLPDGRIVTLSVFPLPGEAEMVEGVICLMADITEQVRLREEAEQGNRLAALGELAAGLAHDINNPVGMLMVNLPMVKDVYRDLLDWVEKNSVEQDKRFGGLQFSFLKEKLPYLLGEMLLNADKIRQLTADMKAFSQQQIVGVTEPVDLNQVVESALRLTNYPLHQATTDLRIELAEELPTVQGRRHQLEQVVVNLLLNAAQALTSAVQAIRVSTSFNADEKQIVLDVVDRGQGIAEENLAEVTKPFFTTRRASGGVGLGLSLSARIVEEHGGKIKISSSSGFGTHVQVMLPLSKVEQ